ncbi:hypothetical protein E4O03_13320 [Treponema sp. OMZ 792]|uniref:hypothetical protein n=1 Tax=unclassified Treponema TaxID=2638727 RepID=UPI0020A503B1|nr:MULTISPECIES: hypothetical protein [unclassified Treponema]UTC75133.1 hypothetical protein E4O03_13320 [Treponema sp. OMZ 792]UTC76503.1 hypothetical protein E4O04_00085 [Treponema sp. OMZ 799]UTC81529.1 hypothetical protein E4O07_13235 [Treponema sp. OMZ 798]
MKNLKNLLLLLSLFPVFSCSYNNIVSIIAPHEEIEIAKEYISKFKEKDFNFIYENSDENIKKQLTQETFNNIETLIPNSKVSNIIMLGSHKKILNEQTYYEFLFEYEYQNKEFRIISLNFKKENTLILQGFRITAAPDSQKNINKFTLKDKTWKHITILLLAILMPLYSIFIFVLCIKTPKFKKKVLWCILILFGIFSVSINWTTGSINLSFFAIYFLSASAMAASPYAAWNISFSIPLFAILFLFKRKKLIKNNQVQT